MIYSNIVLPKVAIIGSGPAGLMSASILARNGCEVHVFEKRKSAARKLLIAGSSGLNITYDAPIGEFISYYECESEIGRRFLDKSIRHFSPSDWIEFIHKLGLETFLGTSKRYFVKDMKGAKLLSSWMKHLLDQNVAFHFSCEVKDFEFVDGHYVLQNKELVGGKFKALVFALGGGSYEEDLSGVKMPWAKMFENHGIKVTPFQASNVGYSVDWPSKFVAECEGLPMKHVNVRTLRGERAGDLVITKYGLEGTPIYAKGYSGEISIDLKPMMSVDEILVKLKSVRENLSVHRRIKKSGILDSVGQSLFFHCGHLGLSQQLEVDHSMRLAAEAIKDFKLILGMPRPINEAISTKGGVAFDGLNEKGESRDCKNVYFAGEMLDFDTVTGGFLIQSAVSTGAYVAEAILDSFDR